MSEYSIRITRKADKDEQLIYEYIVENFGEIYAQKFRGKLFDALEKLKKYPMIGRVAKKDKSLRVLIPNDKNKIVYKVTENEIIVIRILNMKSKDSSLLADFNNSTNFASNFFANPSAPQRITTS